MFLLIKQREQALAGAIHQLYMTQNCISEWANPMMEYFEENNFKYFLSVFQLVFDTFWNAYNNMNIDVFQNIICLIILNFILG